MNNLKRIFLLVALSFASFSFSQSSEDYGKATISANYCLVLDNSSAVQEFYAADASNLGWTSALKAKDWCGFHSNNLVSYTADFEHNRLLIHIHTDRTYQKEDIEWWNNYLLSICQ